MAVFKCKMCGGALEIGENQSIATCDFCGTQQTLPKFDDERKVTLFTRANHLRFNCEFDKAAGVYESIVTEFPDEAEAYWGLVLCKYGIEYVDDSTGKKIPTCHRTLPTSIMDDEDFSSACDYADMSSKSIYREEAKAIDKIQKKILEIASTEKPYDIFICYKETDENTGARTEDSSIAQDIYTELIKEGYKVFFARVTLREVAGTEYEPYIYAALSSAKVMLAIGTKYEYYDAVWVKNEWSRFISMIGEDSSKVLIPCYRNMDAYDMPKEFKNMQALDMGDVTFFASLTANINRLLPKEKVVVKETPNIKTNNNNREIAYADGYYIGEAVADQPNGFGTRVWNDNRKYEGMWKFGKFNGKGTYTYTNGDKYDGEFFDGIKNGQGTMYYANGDNFKGEYKDDKPCNGYGRKEYDNGYYIGQIVNGKSEGKGTYVWSDGDKYEGYWKEGKRNGQGAMYYANGDNFKGEYKDDKPYNGYGRDDYDDGYYIGQIINGKCEGVGTFIGDDGSRFEGNWVADKRNGHGVITYANGDKFVGEYKDDLPYNGHGRDDYDNGYYIGTVSNGKCEGKGVFVFSNGDKFEGEYKNDEPYNGYGRVNYTDGYYIGQLVYGKREGKGIIVLSDGTKKDVEYKNDVVKSGCYVATAVYGSYDCPQVWTLRRYRDYTLAESWYGRAFIRAYYAVSPTLVKWFGHTKWFKRMWQNKLDRMVEKLQSEGYESTPYEDRNW